MKRQHRGKSPGAGGIRIAVALLLLSSPASAGMRMGIVPTKLHLSLEPGASQTATVELSNNGEDAIRVITYVVDWTTPREGGMQFLPPGEVDRSASSWVEADLPEFILPPHESQVVRVSTSLPDTARGSYWALLFFEGEGAAPQRNFGVNAKARMGTTIYLTATGTEERDDALTGMEVAKAAESDTLRLVTSLANRGNVHYYPDGWVQVLDDGGRILFEEKLPLRVLLPGRETVYSTPWRPESTGHHRMVVTVDSGLETLMQGVKRFVVPEPFAPEPFAPEPLAPDPAAVPEPVIARAPPIREVRPASGTPDASTPLYGVHVESFATQAEVPVAKRRYLAMDYPITVKTVDLGDQGIWYRVILGRFADKAEARQFTKELGENFHLEYTAVVQVEP